MAWTSLAMPSYLALLAGVKTSSQYASVRSKSKPKVSRAPAILFPANYLKFKPYAVKELAAQISKDYSGKEFIAVGLLTGAVCFMTDLLKYVRSPYVVRQE